MDLSRSQSGIFHFMNFLVKELSAFLAHSDNLSCDIPSRSDIMLYMKITNTCVFYIFSNAM